MAELRPRAAEDFPSTQSPEDRFAADLRGFGPVGLIALLAITFTGYISWGRLVAFPLGAVLALIWVRLSHTSWREIGYRVPRNWMVTIIGGAALGIALKLLTKAVVMPLLGANPVNPAYHFLADNRALLPRAIWAMLIAGFAEETVFRGYLFERLGKLLGSSRLAKTWIVLITSVWFGLAHVADQGITGAEQALLTGLVFGTIFASSGSIFLLMIAHAAFDLTALTLIYRSLETDVAHWVFN